ncbi:MAG: DUF2780 domain-containing protein [Ignavibacterium sp.]|nr:MAG: DUF2780 domain-containing protein [Ignavibacterium sp.]
MKGFKSVFIISILSVVLLPACSSSSVGGLGSTMELINSLTNLGVSPNQAIGGVGALMNLAQGKLSADDFTKVAGAFPDLDNLMSQAEGLGAFTGQLTDMAGVENSFTNLGMETGMVNQFIPELTSFASNKGGEEVASLLSGAFK